MEVESLHTIPNRGGSPYHTHLLSRSRRPQEYEDMSPAPTPPPPDMMEEKLVKRRSNDVGNVALDEKISPLDPRRFTPSLHANLVAEILTLRRDLESKTKNIDQLEQTLHVSQSQNEALSKSVLASNKEVRSVKRQMQLLEGGTLSALNDLSKERDEAAAECVDLRARIEKSQKRAKNQEEIAERTQNLWDTDKNTWAAERRGLETKIHVVEGRLKVVLTELANVQSTRGQVEQPASPTRSSTFGSPVKRPQSEVCDRRQSVGSMSSDHAGGRSSVLSFAPAATTNLADELGLEDINEVTSDESDHDDGRISPDALPEERERPASSLSIKARRILGLPFDIENMEYSERPRSAADVLSTFGVTPAKCVYVDAGVQYAWPETLAATCIAERDQVNKAVSDKDQSSLDESTTKTNKTGQSQAIQDVSIQPTMVSTSCQTIESLTTAPPTPKQNENVLATILESAFEKAETKEMATQTEALLVPSKQYRYTHSRTDTDDLGIPVIAIVPPKSRPVTPDSDVKLPPRTKNIGCQVEAEVLVSYTSTSMQTEEIRIDRRHLSGLSTRSDAGAHPALSTSAKARSSTSSVRSRNQAIPNSALKRSAPPVPAIPATLVTNDNGPLSRTSVLDKSRPVRTSSLFAGFDDLNDEAEGNFEDGGFDDDDVFNRPVAKFSLRAGKLVSHERSLEDIREFTARSAGEALALETLRQSEEGLPLEQRGAADSMAKAKGLRRTSTIRRGQSVTKSDSMRRAALISNGTAAHQHKHSQSTITSSEGSSVPPPIAIPLRYSSARLNKTFSEGGRTSRSSSNASPTRQGRRVVKPALRKARSGPALSPATSAGRRQRSKSPQLDTHISIVPEMPFFNMPSETQVANPVGLLNAPYEASAPRPSVATGPGRELQHAKTNSDAPLMQQTSVVDAIAQTMVGEWMYKYVRRRKSFGKPEKDWDPNKSADELISNSGSAGVRHKRWVWLAPYERAVMWSSKQPMNGTALMGKSGRKLTIKSVLDVKDENPMPKNSLTGPQFNRSILILTPQRALKFTATSQERHYVWLTALSFLSHSPLSLGDLAALPPPPPPPEEQVTAQDASSSLGGSFRRRNIRDSIRIAKGPNRPAVNQRAFTTDGVLSSEFFDNRPSTQDAFDASPNAAVPPVVRRYHTRKRSNTAPKAPPSAFRSMTFARDTVPSVPTSSHSQSVVTGSSAPYTPSLGMPSVPGTRRGSEASALGRPHPNSFLNFFDTNSSHNASMTVRMDAFIGDQQAAKDGARHARLSQTARGHGSRKDPSHWSFDENGLPNLGPVEFLTSIEPSLQYSSTAGMGKDVFHNF